MFNNKKSQYQVFIRFNDHVLINDNDIDIINDILIDNINEVIFKMSFNGFDMFTYGYNINDINHALNILIDYDYFDLFDTVRVYNYNTGHLYRDIKGGLQWKQLY